ncbi:unnamed protein product, partial [Darwinula stevensoni]
NNSVQTVAYAAEAGQFSQGGFETIICGPDVDKAAYANVRRFINNGEKPPVDAVRIEEMINYFEYSYPAPKGDDIIALRPEDRVAIVTYAGRAGVALPSTPASEKQKIIEGLERLSAGGSTAGAEGIITAYEIAVQNFIKDGNNRVVLATDGDFNVGISDNKSLETLIEEKRFGMGNYKDSKMQILADKGNGNHAYIDDIQEAGKVLVSEFGGTMYTLAKDVKFQIEFNPDAVQYYRLVGYENRMLAKEDFNDDTKDAGELGMGHQMTSIYEIIRKGLLLRNSGSVQDKDYEDMIELADKARGKDKDGYRAEFIRLMKTTKALHSK